MTGDISFRAMFGRALRAERQSREQKEQKGLESKEAKVAKFTVQKAITPAVQLSRSGLSDYCALSPTALPMVPIVLC